MFLHILYVCNITVIQIQQQDGEKNRTLDKISDLELEKNELVKKVAEFQEQNKLHEQKLQIQVLKSLFEKYVY